MYFYAIDVDTVGNLYGSDYCAVYMLEYSADGTATWKVVAGTPWSAGFSGDGGPATFSQLSYVQDIALDASANVYIADYNNCRVRLVTKSTGKITTIAGNGVGDLTDAGDGGPAMHATTGKPSR